MKIFIAAIMVLVGVHVLSTSVYAQTTTKGFTLSPMIGRYLPADERNIEDASFLSLALGYDFNERWGLEGSYLTGSSEISGSAADIDYQALRLDALYHFSNERLRPYLAFGLGNSEFDASAGNDDSEAFANAGVGIKYAVNHYLDLRADTRFAYGFDVEDLDFLVGLGLSFKFGNSSTNTQSKPLNAKLSNDSDRDGIPNSLDRCLDSIANTAVDKYGCAMSIKDSDNDGVIDGQDRCPNSKRGAKVNEQGCYLALDKELSISLDIKFATNSDVVDANSYSEVERVAEFMRSYPETEVVIEGHTDDRGSATYNRQLSESRVAAVAQILNQNYDIAKGRITSIGYGEDRPLVSNDSPENRALNRRVVAVIRMTVKQN